MRDKLIELIVDVENDLFRQRNNYSDSERIEKTADYLISHGVTLATDNNVGGKEAEPVKHGRWLVLGQRTYGSGRNYTHYCSICGQHGFDDYEFCPNCGCKMDLEDTK